MNRTILAALLFSISDHAPATELQLSIVDQDSGESTPARVHLRDEGGKAQRPNGFPSWNDHFVCHGNARLNIPAGKYALTVERGPEYTAAERKIIIQDGPVTNITVQLHRITNLAAEGWWSGETHVHRNLADVELLMQAEDLHFAQVITWWNKTNPWAEAQLPEPIVKGFDGNRFYHRMSGEDERDGGALLYCDLSRPLEITGGTQHYPSSITYAKQARALGTQWIDAEKPFWWDFPLWLAQDVIDTVGIAHNHMQRNGVLENEAWGRARDRAKYPGPHGNALWTQSIYYHALNCGLRLPPSAGSASGVLPNPVGYNRAYVHVQGELTYQKWREGLLAGKSFVSNGLLLRCRANSELPGHNFKNSGPMEFRIEGKLDSRDPIRAVELVRNGQVQTITLPATFRMEESGWFLVRAIASPTHTFRFASTAPWYVEIAGHSLPVQKESAQFFVVWCQERIRLLDGKPLSASQKEEVLSPWRSALGFWETKLAQPTK